MSILKTNNVQIGQSTTATNNFVLSVPAAPDGSLKLARGDVEATTQDILNVASDGAISTPNSLSFTGTGNRITGDFSNATVANRVMFQTSTVDGNTRVWTIPNGSATTTQIVLANASNPTNASILTTGATAADTRFESTIAGTGTYLPMTFYTGGVERMRIDINGNVGIGMTPAPASAYKLQVNSQAGGVVFDSIQGYSRAYFPNVVSPTVANTWVGSYYDDVTIGTVGISRLSVDASGNVLVTSPGRLGYGVGAGGSVTQATSKSTTVTLNKACGQITMNNAAMPPGWKTGFILTNSTITPASVVLVNVVDFGGYSAEVVYSTSYANCQIVLTNTLQVSLSEAVKINFVVISGATT